MCGGLFGFIVCPIKHIFHSIGVFLRHNQLVGDVIVIASAIACAPYGASAACAAGASAEISFFETGRIAPALEAGAITYGTTVAFNAVGGEFDPGADGTSAFENAVVSNGIGNSAEASVANYIGDIAGDGLVGGLSSVAQGGSFESGFLAAGFSSAVAPFATINGTTTEDTIINTASQSVTGGFGSMIGGGSFENGAVTGAFRYLYNQAILGVTGGTTAAEAYGNSQARSEEIAAESAFENSSFYQTIKYMFDQVTFYVGGQRAAVAGNAGYEVSGGAYASMGDSVGGYASGGPASGVAIGGGLLYGINFGSLNGPGYSATVSGLDVSISVNMDSFGEIEGFAAGPSEEYGVVFQQSHTYTFDGRLHP